MPKSHHFGRRSQQIPGLKRDSFSIHITLEHSGQYIQYITDIHALCRTDSKDTHGVLGCKLLIFCHHQVDGDLDNIEVDLVWSGCRERERAPSNGWREGQGQREQTKEQGHTHIHTRSPERVVLQFGWRCGSEPKICSVKAPLLCFLVWQYPAGMWS